MCLEMCKFFNNTRDGAECVAGGGWCERRERDGRVWRVMDLCSRLDADGRLTVNARIHRVVHSRRKRHHRCVRHFGYSGHVGHICHTGCRHVCCVCGRKIGGTVVLHWRALRSRRIHLWIRYIFLSPCSEPTPGRPPTQIGGYPTPVAPVRSRVRHPGRIWLPLRKQRVECLRLAQWGCNATRIGEGLCREFVESSRPLELTSAVDDARRKVRTTRDRASIRGDREEVDGAPRATHRHPSTVPAERYLLHLPAYIFLLVCRQSHIGTTYANKIEQFQIKRDVWMDNILYA